MRFALRGAAARLRGLHVLADDDPRWGRDPVEQGRAACAGGAAVVQLRAKRASDREALAWAEALRARLLVGRSSHTLAEACAAREEPVDYVAFGPVFGTASKDSPHPARGLEMLGRAAAAVAPLPLVAIGGIHAGNAGAAIAAGAAGVAVISAVAGASDPEAAARELALAVAGARRS